MTTRRDLLDAEERGWHDLHGRLEKIPHDRWTEPGAAGEWCVKDLLAHVSCWQAQLADWLEALRSSGAKPGRIDVEAMNQDFHVRCQDLDVHDVQVMSGAARHRAREELGHAEEPLSEGWTRLIAMSLHGHYEEHLPDLDAFIEKGSA